MAIQLPQGFDIRSTEPVDDRFVVADRTGISTFISYTGLVVYQTGTNNGGSGLYVLTDGTTPGTSTNWEPVDTGNAFNLISEQSVTPAYSFTYNFAAVTNQSVLTIDGVPSDLRLNAADYELITVGTTTLANPLSVTSYNVATNALTLQSIIPSGNLIVGDVGLTFRRISARPSFIQVESDAINTDIEGDISIQHNLVLNNLPTSDSRRVGTVWSDDGTLVLAGSTKPPVVSTTATAITIDGTTTNYPLGSIPLYDRQATYTLGALVIFDNAIYRNKQPILAGEVFDPASWTLIGDDGDSIGFTISEDLGDNSFASARARYDVEVVNNVRRLELVSGVATDALNIINFISPANTPRTSVNTGDTFSVTVDTTLHLDGHTYVIPASTSIAVTNGPNNIQAISIPYPTSAGNIGSGVSTPVFTTSNVKIVSGHVEVIGSDDIDIVLDDTANTLTISSTFEDAPDWSGLSAYTVDDVVNFRNNIYKRRTQNIGATTGVSIVPGFTTLVSFKNNVSNVGALGYADTFSFADPNIAAPALTSGVVYRFTIGSGSTQYVVDADPGSTDVTANVGSLYGNGLQSPAASNGRIWQLRLLTPTGIIAPGYTIVSVGDTVYTTAQQAAAQTALLALLATKPDGTAIDNLDEGDQISFGGSPNTAPSEDISWELISNATLASSRYDLIEGELISFHQIPNGSTTASLNESDANRLLYDGRVIGLTTIQFEALGDRTLTDGTQAITLPNGMAENYPVGTWATGRGASFHGIFTGQSVTKLAGDAAEAIRIRITSLRQDNSEAIVALDDTTVVPGLGTITRPGDVIQIARLEDVAPVTSIDEFDTQIVPNNSDAITLGTNFEPSEQVTYLTSFAPRENVEYNGEFYFYIGPGSHADFLHDAALRPQEFTNADFVPGNNKLNWVTYNEFINDISEADRSYSERIAATRDVTLHAQVRREIEAAKQDVLLTLSDRDSEREDQLVSLRPIWRLANTRYDDGSRFRRNVLYNAIRTDSTYTLTAGNRENTRGYNVFGTTGTVTFNGIIAVGAATVSGTVITIPTPNGTALTQAQIATAQYGSVGFRSPVNLLTRNGLVSYSASATALTLTFSSASLASFTHDEFLGASGRLVIINTTQTTVNRKAASLCWVEFVEGSTRFTGEGLVIDDDGVIGRQELVSALDTTSPEDNNGVILGIENSDTTVHYFNSAKPWDDDFFTATGDQAVHCTVSAGNTGAAGTTFNDTRVSALGAAQRFAWSARTYEDNPEDYFDLDPSANEYIIDNYNFAARASGLVITGALLEPAVKSYSGFIWIASNASNMSNEALHPQNRVVQTPFRNVNTIDLSQFQSSLDTNNALLQISGVTQIQTLKMYGLSDTTIATINSGNRVDLRFTLNEPGTDNPPVYQLSTVGTTPFRTATSELDVSLVDTTSRGVVALPELSRFTWQLDARAAGTITRPTLATEAYTADNITAGTAVQGAFFGAHGIITNESRYFQDSTKQWAPVSNVSREFNNSLFSRGEVISPDTVVRGSDGTYYKWTFRGRANSFDVGVIIRYDNVQVTRDAAGRFSSSSIDAVGNTSIYDPASVDATTFIDNGSTTSTSIASLNDLNNLFQVNSVHPFTVEYDGYFNLAAGESATNASIIIGGTTTTGTGVTNHAELNRFVLMDPTALHAQATLIAGGGTSAQAIRDAHAFNNLWSVLDVNENYPQYRSTVHNAIGVFQDTTLQYNVDASRLQGTSIENVSPRTGQILKAVEITDPADSTSTIQQWQPTNLVDTIPEHSTIPVTNPGANTPTDLVGWELETGRPGQGLQRDFIATNGTSPDRIDLDFIDAYPRIRFTFSDGSTADGSIIGDSRSTITTTQLIGRFDVPRQSSAAGVTETVTIRYYGEDVPVAYTASPLTVNAAGEVIYGGNEIATVDQITGGGNNIPAWNWNIASTGQFEAQTTANTIGAVTGITIIEYDQVLGTGTHTTWYEYVGTRLNADGTALVAFPTGSVYSTHATNPFATGAVTIQAF